jgi:hypothetical protein
MHHKLPKLTNEPLIYVDATPDENYPLRILRTHRENCNAKWSASPSNILYDKMNEDQDKRAEILDRAIEVLEKNLINK